MTHFWKVGITLAATALVTACGPVAIQSNPDTFAVPDGAGKEIRAPQSVALNNAYPGPQMQTVFPAGVTWVGDLKAYTDTAITMLNRQMTKHGVNVSPSAQKMITLRVHSVHAGPAGGGFVIRASLALDAAYGDGTRSAIQVQNTSPSDAHRAMSGALMRAVTQLLHDQYFLAYMNK